MQPGESQMIALPDRQPARRITYQAIGSAAHHTWGVGTYRLVLIDGAVRLERIGPTVIEPVSPERVRQLYHEFLGE